MPERLDGDPPAAAKSADSADFAMPEFTRALRGLASARALGRAEHASVFGPLVAARKLAEHAASVRARVAAFDAARLKAAWLESIESIAAARVPKAGPDRRAQSARLTEQAGPMLAGIRALEIAAERVGLEGDAPRADSWRAWIAAVQLLFDSADRFWFTIEPELGPRPPVRRKGRGAAARDIAT
jgi:hypothetical protein